MTRRDFQLIAATLKAAHAPIPVVHALAQALAGTNPRFDHARFMWASGVAYVGEGGVVQPPALGWDAGYTGEGLA